MYDVDDCPFQLRLSTVLSCKPNLCSIDNHMFKTIKAGAQNTLPPVVPGQSDGQQLLDSRESQSWPDFQPCYTYDVALE